VRFSKIPQPVLRVIQSNDDDYRAYSMPEQSVTVKRTSISWQMRSRTGCSTITSAGIPRPQTSSQQAHCIITVPGTQTRRLPLWFSEGGPTALAGAV